MNYIDSLDHLVELLKNDDLVVFLPGMRGGKSVLDWLEYSENLWHVSCFAMINEMYPYPAQFTAAKDSMSEKNLPVLPIHCLQHYRENGIFVVAMNPNLHDEVHNRLAQFGCKNIFFLSENAYNQITQDLKKYVTPEQVMQRFMTQVTKKLNRLELAVTEQNEICALNSAAFEKYRNAFRGKKVVIFAGGPTANYYSPIENAIHIGINFA